MCFMVFVGSVLGFSTCLKGLVKEFPCVFEAFSFQRKAFRGLGFMGQAKKRGKPSSFLFSASANRVGENLLTLSHKPKTTSYTQNPKSLTLRPEPL